MQASAAGIFLGPHLWRAVCLKAKISNLTTESLPDSGQANMVTFVLSIHLADVLVILLGVVRAIGNFWCATKADMTVWEARIWNISVQTNYGVSSDQDKMVSPQSLQIGCTHFVLCATCFSRNLNMPEQARCSPACKRICFWTVVKPCPHTSTLKACESLRPRGYALGSRALSFTSKQTTAFSVVDLH